MTNLEIYKALSLRGRRGAKNEVQKRAGVSVNMIARVLKHGCPSNYESVIVEHALEIIREYEAREERVAEMRLVAAKEQYIQAQREASRMLAP